MRLRKLAPTSQLRVLAKENPRPRCFSDAIYRKSSGSGFALILQGLDIRLDVETIYFQFSSREI